MQIKHVHLSRRGIWLLGSVVFTWAIVLVPSMFLAPIREPGIVVVAQLVCCGVILGAGRQGVDILLLRVIASTLSFVVAGIWTNHGVCRGLLDCLQYLLLGGVAFGVYGAAIITIVAFPTSILWSRGLASMRLELPPWLLIVLGVMLIGGVGLSFILLLLSFGWPP